MSWMWEGRGGESRATPKFRPECVEGWRCHQLRWGERVWGESGGHSAGRVEHKMPVKLPGRDTPKPRGSRAPEALGGTRRSGGLEACTWPPARGWWAAVTSGVPLAPRTAPARNGRSGSSSSRRGRTTGCPSTRRHSWLSCGESRPATRRTRAPSWSTAGTPVPVPRSPLRPAAPTPPPCPGGP